MIWSVRENRSQARLTSPARKIGEAISGGDDERTTRIDASGVAPACDANEDRRADHCAP